MNKKARETLFLGLFLFITAIAFSMWSMYIYTILNMTRLAIIAILFGAFFGWGSVTKLIETGKRFN